MAVWKSPVEITNGSIKGDNIAFDLTFENPDVITHTLKLNIGFRVVAIFPSGKVLIDRGCEQFLEIQVSAGHNDIRVNCRDSYLTRLLDVPGATALRFECGHADIWYVDNQNQPPERYLVESLTRPPYVAAPTEAAHLPCK